MKPLDERYVLKRLLQTEGPLHESYRLRWEIVKTYGFKSLLVLPDDFIMRLEPGDETFFFVSNAHDPVVHEVTAVGIVGFYSSAGHMDIENIEDIRKLETEIAPLYNQRGLKRAGFELRYHVQGWHLKCSSIIWPMLALDLLFVSSAEAGKAYDLMQKGELCSTL